MCTSALGVRGSEREKDDDATPKTFNILRLCRLSESQLTAHVTDYCCGIGLTELSFIFIIIHMSVANLIELCISNDAFSSINDNNKYSHSQFRLLRLGYATDPLHGIVSSINDINDL